MRVAEKSPLGNTFHNFSSKTKMLSYTISFLLQGGSEQLSDSSAPAEKEQESSGDVQQYLGSSANRPFPHGPARTFSGSQCGRSGPSNEGLQHGHVINIGHVKSFIHSNNRHKTRPTVGERGMSI